MIYTGLLAAVVIRFFIFNLGTIFIIFSINYIRAAIIAEFLQYLRTTFSIPHIIYRELISLHIRAIFLFLRISDQNIYSIDVIQSTVSFISFEFVHSYKIWVHIASDFGAFF